MDWYEAFIDYAFDESKKKGVVTSEEEMRDELAVMTGLLLNYGRIVVLVVDLQVLRREIPLWAGCWNTR